MRGALALILALVGHAVLVVALLFLSHLKLDTPPLTRAKLDRPVSFRPLGAAQFDQNRGKDAPALAMRESKRPDTPKEKEKKVPEQAPGQVVDVAPGNGEVSQDAKFAAETNNTSSVAFQTNCTNSTFVAAATVSGDGYSW